MVCNSLDVIDDCDSGRHTDVLAIRAGSDDDILDDLLTLFTNISELEAA